MALITQFTERRSASIGWRSQVECGYNVGEHHNRRVLHLETYGSSGRQIPGKVSQSIQLDEAAAANLVRILRQAFPALR